MKKNAERRVRQAIRSMKRRQEARKIYRAMVCELQASIQIMKARYPWHDLDGAIMADYCRRQIQWTDRQLLGT